MNSDGIQSSFVWIELKLVCWTEFQAHRMRACLNITEYFCHSFQAYTSEEILRRQYFDGMSIMKKLCFENLAVISDWNLLGLGWWSDWTSWRPCNGVCEWGSKSRTRECPAGYCEGVDSETIQCDLPVYCSCKYNTWWVHMSVLLPLNIATS